MSLDAAILGFLGERPRSGYDLKTRCFDDAAKDFWTGIKRRSTALWSGFRPPN